MRFACALAAASTGTARTGAIAATFLATAATAAAALARALAGLADRATGPARDAHAERPRPDPQETTLALFDRRDHGLGAGQLQRVESLPYRLIERLAFIQ